VEFTASPSDVLRVVDAARNVPVMLAGRMIGLSGNDLRAGVPAWAWTTLALGVGFALGAVYGPQVRQRVKAVL